MPAAAPFNPFAPFLEAFNQSIGRFIYRPVTDWVHDWDWLDDQWGSRAVGIWNEIRERERRSNSLIANDLRWPFQCPRLSPRRSESSIAR